MPTVDLTLPHHRYDIVIEPGCLMRLGELVREAIPSADKAILVTDEGVEPYHARPAAKAMQGGAADGDSGHASGGGGGGGGIDTVVAVIPVSEKKKTLGTVRTLYDIMLDNHLERGHALVTLGGGICGDVAGYAAATYLRGIRFVQCPTTLLAMVDASVGGKTGVNVPQGKNLIGAFHQPSRVVIDPQVLTTLPERELRCGLAECLKHGMIRDPQDGQPPLFDWIIDHAPQILSLDMPTLVELVKRNVEIKAAVVMADEKEAGERAHLNLGHTFAHAIEATGQFGTKYKHGEAVSLGLVAATAFAVNRKLCAPELLDRVIAGCAAVGLPTSAKHLAPNAILLKTMTLDKKVRAGRLRLVLPVRMGEVIIVQDATADEVAAAWDAIR